MLENKQSNKQNLTSTTLVLVVMTATIAVMSSFSRSFCLLLLLLPAVYWFLRRKTKRRLQVMAANHPAEWEQILNARVNFFVALEDTDKQRFLQMMKVFLDETPVTGVRVDVDTETRVLVAASAVIPVFGFDDWEYSSLGEVLIYPGSFDTSYESSGEDDENILGMVGDGHLRGIMILSKPALIAGFANPNDKRNVGIHEFAHLVDMADGTIDGLPAGIPASVVRPWIQWVGGELKRPAQGNEHVDDYAFTNEAEYFAVLTEYFFESPELLARRDPKTYEMMQKMYRQNTRKLLTGPSQRRRKRIGRNAKCVCGSGRKFKHCCRRT